MPADGGILIGWAHPMDTPVATYMNLLYEHGMQPCLSSTQVGPSPVIFWMPAADDGQRVVSNLIEQNAWVRPASTIGLSHMRP